MVLQTAHASAPPDNASKTCDLCGGQRFELVSQRDRNGNELYTAMCLDCGLVCHRDIPSDHQLTEFYSLNYRREYHGESIPSARRVMRAWKNGQRILQQLKTWVSPGAAVFEVGAGIGCTVKAFECAGFAAAGIDLGREFAAYSRDKLHARVENRGLFELQLRPQFDLVLLVHVIEHFNSPRRALSHIRQLLRPLGQLYVECPNLAAPPARFSRLFHFAHVHNFTPATLQMLAEQTGFEVRHRFSRDDNPNLQMLFRCSERGLGEIDLSNVDATRRSLNHAQSWHRYHLRPRYLLRRAVKLTGYIREHLMARPYIRRLERHLASSNGGSSGPSLPY